MAIYGDRGRIGFLIPANNTILEAECAHFLPNGVTAHFSRIATDRIFSIDEAHNIESRHDLAVEQISGAFVDIIAYACMASAIAVRVDWSGDFVSRVQKRTKIPAVSVSQSTADALHAIGAIKIAIGATYPSAMNPILEEWCEYHGFQAVRIHNLSITDKKEICLTPLKEIKELGLQTNCTGADAVALLATDIRALPVVTALENEIGKPVVTSNAALIWAALGFLRISDSIQGAGRLLETIPRPNSKAAKVNKRLSS